MKPTKTADELKQMIRREAGFETTVGIVGRPDGGWAFATPYWGPKPESLERVHAYAHELQQQYDLAPAG